MNNKIATTNKDDFCIYQKSIINAIIKEYINLVRL